MRHCNCDGTTIYIINFKYICGHIYVCIYIIYIIIYNLCYYFFGILYCSLRFLTLHVVVQHGCAYNMFFVVTFYLFRSTINTKLHSSIINSQLLIFGLAFLILPCNFLNYVYGAHLIQHAIYLCYSD